VKPKKLRVIAAAAGFIALLAWWQLRVTESPPWSAAEIAVLQSLSVGSLPPLPPDPSNAVADDPLAADLGARLFLDTRLSANGGISCATCHQPARHFTDGLPKARAIGTSNRNTPSIVGTAYSPWLYWDGRRDSQWSQALSPLEDPNEHGINRLQVARLVAEDDSYRQQYETLFGPLPDIGDTDRFPKVKGAPQGESWNIAWSAMAADDRFAINRIFSNVGKAIAAFERTLLPKASPFDDYVAAVAGGDFAAAEHILTDDEIRGLRLFIGEASCTQCHNGPLLTNNEFHNTGVLSAEGQLPDKGRVTGVREVLANPFNCLGEYSDDAERFCPELLFVRTGPELVGAMRTPSLRNVEKTAPYMHNGQVATLEQALAHYNEAPDAMIGHNEAKPLTLGTRQLRQMNAFLRTLSTPPEAGQSESM
jgi:cytochrome c peroxidase